MLNRRLFDTSSELCLQRYHNGIKLMKPTYQTRNENLTVAEMFSTNCNMYFLNMDGELQYTNEIHAEIFGYLSMKDALGKTVFDMTTAECASRIRQNDLEVMKSEKYKVMEENLDPTRPEAADFTGLTIKFPWYNVENKIIGLLGCTIVFDKQPLADSLSKIFELGLLNTSTRSSKKMLMPGKDIHHVYLSKRQNEILRMIVRGKTIKEISEILGLSKRTVGHYFETIKMKMNVSTKSELIDKVIDSYI